MIRKCHSQIWICAIGLLALVVGLYSGLVVAQEEAAEPEQKNNEAGPEVVRQALPTIDELIDAKINALKAKQVEQDLVMAQADLALEKELALEKQTFDNQAYLSMSMINTAPASDYRLESSEVFLDGSWRPVAKGGPRNRGLPRNNEQIFFSPIAPGCHEVMVRAKYIRLKNDLISRFKDVKRIEVIKKIQPFIASNGYRVELEIEGYEQANTIVNMYRGPNLRFNKSVRPNFLPGAPIVSMDAVLKQGQVRIDYATDDLGSHRLLNKSLSIDGLPVLSAKEHDQNQEKNLIFQAPLQEGEHRLNLTLLLAENKRVAGGPQYNFRLNFDRKFYVSSGNTTVINLLGLPSGGFRSNPFNSRYARATSKILSEEHPEFFPTNSCRELRAIESAAKKNAQPVAEPVLEVPVEVLEAPAEVPTEAPLESPEVPAESPTEVPAPSENPAGEAVEQAAPEQAPLESGELKVGE